MINQTIIAILLITPLIIMLIPSIKFWLEFKKEKTKGKEVEKTKYNKPFFYLFVVGLLFGMWVPWIGGSIFLFMNKFYSTFAFLMFSTSYEIAIQVVGLFIFYIGAITYNLNIIIVGKYLRPAPSGLLKDHKLVQEGPFRIIRHPLYVSYILISIGLSLTLQIHWLLIPLSFMIIGIYPTAKDEEETLIKQFGDEYRKYKIKVGMLFPKLF